jgi:hypothetical protein
MSAQSTWKAFDEAGEVRTAAIRPALLPQTLAFWRKHSFGLAICPRSDTIPLNRCQKWRFREKARSFKSNLEETSMYALLSFRKTVARGAVAIAFAVCACVAARADSLVQTVTLTPSGSNDNVTNGDVYTVFNDAVNFNQFNSTLGTLNSATLSWSGAGSLTVGGNFEGQATMSYQTSSETEGWNIDGGSTTVDFSISSGGDESLSLAGLTGSGAVTEGSFDETFQLSQGLFPDSFATGPTSGTFTLAYDYTPPLPPSSPLLFRNYPVSRTSSPHCY